MRRHLFWLMVPFLAFLGCPECSEEGGGEDDGPDDDDAVDLGVEDASAVVLGVEPDAEVGVYLDTGDLDGDGFEDLVVFAAVVTWAEGEIYVFHGPLVGTRTTAEADAVVSLGPPGTGSWLTGVADIDRDGVDDLLVGTYTAGGPPAVAYGFRGPLPPASSLAQADFLFTIDVPGWVDRTVEVVPAGDLDGDGEEDLAVAVQGPEGMHGENREGAVLPLVDAIPPGDVALDLAPPRIVWWGFETNLLSLSRVGDVDGDGLDDLMVHVLEVKSEVMDSYLFPGPLAGAPQVADAPMSVAGYAAAGNFARPGDLNGDGRDDLISRDYWIWEGTPGEAWWFGGLDEGAWTHADADAHVLGASNADYLGKGASIGGDLDGDGRQDLVLGAWGSDAVVPEGGVTYLWTEEPSGELSLADAALRIHGAHGGEMAGARLLSGADLDGDGLDDLLIGAPDRSTESGGGGAVYLFSGAQLCAVLDR